MGTNNLEEVFDAEAQEKPIIRHQSRFYPDPCIASDHGLLL